MNETSALAIGPEQTKENIETPKFTIEDEGGWFTLIIHQDDGAMHFIPLSCDELINLNTTVQAAFTNNMKDMIV